VSRPTSFIRRAHLAVFLMGALIVFVSAPTLVDASPPPPVIRRIDTRIYEARRNIRHLDARLSLQLRRITKTSVVLGRVTSSSGSPLGKARVAFRKALMGHALAWKQRKHWRRVLHRYVEARSKLVASLAGRGVSGLPAGPVTYKLWAHALLHSIGAPDCLPNLRVVVAWETAESTSSRYNPLATTFVVPGGTVTPTSRVQSYASFAQGIDATRHTFLSEMGYYNYAAVVDDLISCRSADVTAAAIRDSYWCRGCARGYYVINQLSGVRQDWAGHASRLVGFG
jgi:hypothetical protein